MHALTDVCALNERYIKSHGGCHNVTKVQDTGDRIMKLNWYWVEHIARHNNDRWIKAITE